LLYNLTHH